MDRISANDPAQLTTTTICTSAALEKEARRSDSQAMAGVTAGNKPTRPLVMSAAEMAMPASAAQAALKRASSSARTDA